MSPVINSTPPCPARNSSPYIYYEPYEPSEGERPKQTGALPVTGTRAGGLDSLRAGLQIFRALQQGIDGN